MPSLAVPALLGALALVLAGPVPRALARSPRLRLTPRSAMLLWQSTALAAVLAALGAGAALVTDRLWGTRASRADVGALDVVVGAAAVLLTSVVVVRLVLSGHRTGTALRRARRRHRQGVDLVARTDGGMSVLEHDLPVAYCLPGMAGSRIVVSRSTLVRLAPDELAAVVEHERAHLRSRHDLVLEAFAVLHRAFPRWVGSAAARGEVEVLVEVLADRAAVRRTDRRALLGALVALAGTPRPEGALGVTHGLAARAEVLRDTRPRPVQAAALQVTALGLLALPTVLVVAPWLLALRPT